MPVNNRQAKQIAHDGATCAWAVTTRLHARTAGLAEMLRGSRKAPQTTEQRKSRQEAHKQRLRSIFSRSHLPDFDSRTLDRSRYFPHQGDRQRNRAARKCQS